ncbi:hypothetical protein [Saccharomonospora glauca]|uniref:Secreted protein n=1 Tax=Saccharomonospora glauca K62 TaxID=928724 RepID=I1D0T8_9PSEU|nr:hypothetical protein [Saccharomonospora glauca]EIE98562.1 hypothetical protein SacglDRAFT_01647 [Saccharomonospora glauca K62]
MRRLRVFASGVAALALAFLPTTATAAQELAADGEGASVAAYEIDKAKKGTPPSSGVICPPDIPGARVCFEPYGDKWWVKDTAADGASAVVTWRNYRNGSLYRSGQCENRMGSGTWGVCNKNYYEGSDLLFQIHVYDFSEGKEIRYSNVVGVRA